jgi:hypothetical protein
LVGNISIRGGKYDILAYFDENRYFSSVGLISEGLSSSELRSIQARSGRNGHFAPGSGEERTSFCIFFGRIPTNVRKCGLVFSPFWGTKGLN